MPLYTAKLASKQAQSGGANFPANRTGTIHEERLSGCDHAPRSSPGCRQG
jgi:hypothetical protein